MMISLCKSKIHRATVTETNLDYVGSLTIDQTLMRLANLREFERVTVANITNGERFDTYVIKGGADTGEMCVNGAAAHKASVGDLIIVCAYGLYSGKEAEQFAPSIVFVNAKNAPVEIKSSERAGEVYPATAT